MPTVTRQVVPASVVAGTRVPGFIRTNLTNLLSDFEKTTETGYFSVRVFASTTTTLDEAVNPVLGYTVRRATLPVGRTIGVTVPFRSLPSNLAAGTYHLLLESTDSAGNTEVVDTGSTVVVVAQVVALSTSFNSLATNILSAGTVLSIANSGNVDYRTTFTATVGFSTDAAGHNVVATGAGRLRPARVLIRAGRASNIFVTGWQPVLATLPAGSYFFTITLVGSDGRTITAVSPQQV